MYLTMMISYSIMGTIITINLVLKMVIIKLISMVGYDTHSELMTKISNGVFIGLFFNTGVLFLLTNANLSDVSPRLGSMLQSTYYDYSPRWYAMVGATLVQTM